MYKVFVEDKGLHIMQRWDQEDDEREEPLDDEAQMALDKEREQEWLGWLAENKHRFKIGKYRPKLNENE